jgi:hypothetical protein
MSEHPGRPDRGSPDTSVEQRSFGGATTIETAGGTLLPEALLIGPRHASLHACWRGSATPDLAFHHVPEFDDVIAVDDQGARYALQAEAMSARSEPSGETGWPATLHLALDPVPGLRARWVELRGKDGTATRLLPSARPPVQAGQLTPAAISPAEQELSELGLSLIALQSGDAGTAAVQKRCSAVLTRMTELQRSGELDAASVLPGQLTQLCAALTEHHIADSLPPSWSGMLTAAGRRDGPGHHLDLATALPPIDGVTVQIDSLFSQPGSWRLYLRAMPGWWKHSKDRTRKWSPISVNAEDDRGGTYASNPGSGTRHRDHEEFALRFLPRLDPIARALKLTFRGASEEIAVTVALETVAGSQLE